jgi:hypothetical protein
MTEAEDVRAFMHDLRAEREKRRLARAPETAANKADASPVTEQLVMRMFVDENKDRLRYNHDLKRRALLAPGPQAPRVRNGSGLLPVAR